MVASDMGVMPAARDFHSGLRRVIPEFAADDRELAYRLHTQRDACRLAQRVAVIAGVLTLLFFANDRILAGRGAAYYTLITVRVLMALWAFWLAATLRPATPVPQFDRRVLCWWYAFLVMDSAVCWSRPPGFFLHVLVAEALVFACFLLMPLRFPHRVASSLVPTTGHLSIVVLNQSLKASELTPLLLSMMVAILVGGWVSFELARVRRLEFARLIAEQASNERLSREIEERTRLSAILAESERNLLRIFDVAPIPLSLTDGATGLLLRANQALLDLLPASPDGGGDEGAVRLADLCLDPADAGELTAAVEVRGAIDGWELRGHASDGGERWLAVSARRFEYQGQAAVLACWYDLSARIAQEQALRQAKQEAEAADRAKSRFLSMISHEVRTPLNGVLGTLQLMADERLDAAQRSHLDTARHAADALVELLDTVLDYARFESGQQGLTLADFDLHETLAQAVAPYQVQAQAEGLAFELEVDAPAPLALYGDVTRLRQVLHNLLSNAIKFTTAGRIALHAKVEPLGEGKVMLEFSVSDTGIGIAPAMQLRIFDPFIQADGSIARRFGGAGLGLAVCREIIRLMGGDIEVESAPGRGSAFRVRLPLRFGEMRVARPDEDVAMARSLTLLLVEDDAASRRVGRGLLERLGHQATTVESGEEALAVLVARSFDAVLMDLHLPGLDGLTTTRRIRALRSGRAADIPVLALTADLTAETLRHCREAGMAAVVAKPVRLGALRRVLAGLGDDPAAGGTLPVHDEVGAALEDALVDPALFQERLDALGPARLFAAGRDFRRVALPALAELGDAIRTLDRERIAQLAHRLRSAAGTLGLIRLRELATSLEAGAAIANQNALAQLLSEATTAYRGSLRALLGLGRALMSGPSNRHAAALLEE